jgi:hypothetical protein
VLPNSIFSIFINRITVKYLQNVCHVLIKSLRVHAKRAHQLITYIFEYKWICKAYLYIYNMQQMGIPKQGEPTQTSRRASDP